MASHSRWPQTAASPAGWPLTGLWYTTHRPTGSARRIEGPRRPPERAAPHCRTTAPGDNGHPRELLRIVRAPAALSRRAEDPAGLTRRALACILARRLRSL